ncbi:MAG: class I SAM-dependent methyltransferase [Cytophagaceae bacterium]|jgi:SAM-dependent methyltransferase|nr:class I SAM-dependent methyltransferase [Cytophagaceae bacterium]
MTEQEQRSIAAQLRQPHGDEASIIAERMNKGNAIMNRTTLSFLPKNKPYSVLEIGMANGFFVRELIEQSPDAYYTGIDFSEEMVEAAKNLNAEWVKNGRVHFLLEDIQKPVSLHKTFDAIYTVNTLYFWENPIEVLDRIRQLLNDNGSFILTIRPKHVMEKYPFTAFGFTMYSKEELVQLFPEQLWEIKEIKEIVEPIQYINGVAYAVEALCIHVIKK